jgi:hypothetical protein
VHDGVKGPNAHRSAFGCDVPLAAIGYAHHKGGFTGTLVPVSC